MELTEQVEDRNLENAQSYPLENLTIKPAPLSGEQQLSARTDMEPI